MHNDLNNLTMTVNRLFQAAFHSSEVVYRQESLCGWRPLTTGTLLWTPLQSTASADTAPGVHVRETAERFVIEVELPRIKADSLYIEISGDLLIIRGERDTAGAAKPAGKKPDSGGPMVHRYIQLPISARPGQVHARLEGNTVKVNIQKRTRSH
jgi:HSP20 family molecular chaperone IbpA